MKIIVDDEFRNLIPKLESTELAGLENGIVTDGCLSPLVVWKETGILVDGHNRYDICTENEIEFDVTEMSFDSREEAFDWMDAHQLGQRNLSADDRRLLIGRRYERRKKPVGAPVGNDNKNQIPQNGVIDNTAEKLSEEHGVSKNTVQRAGEFARAVAKVEENDTNISKEDSFKKAKENLKAEKEERRRQAKAISEANKAPYCNGMQFARIAVEKLGQIQPNDTERQQAFDYVKEYINANS